MHKITNSDNNGGSSGSAIAFMSKHLNAVCQCSIEAHGFRGVSFAQDPCASLCCRVASRLLGQGPCVCVRVCRGGVCDYVCVW